MMRSMAILLLLTAAMVGESRCNPAIAQQATPPALPNPQPIPEAPPAAGTPPPDEIRPREDTGRSTESMSDRLSKQGGTLTPPNVDREMAISPPAAEAGKMPVIPPPGTSGGNPNVQPK